MSHATPEELAESRELVWLLCEGLLRPEKEHRLEQLMRGHRSIRVLYFELVQLHAALIQRAGSLLSRQPESSPDDGTPDGRDLSDAMILPAIHLPVETQEPRTQEQSPAAPSAARPQAKRGPARSMRIGDSRSLRWLGAAAVLLCIGLVVAFLMHGSPPVTVTNSFDAHFEEDGLSTSNGAQLAGGRKMTLSHGFVELTFVSGAHVLVEAPAAFSVDSSNAMTLDSGKISAVADGDAHGFKVSTPNASVVDLGTQFGVNVAGSLATDVQVFKGQVLVSPRSSAAPDGGRAGQTLSAGDAGQVRAGVVSIKPGGASAQAFVRTLTPVTSPIDVVDLVAGGDGTTHRRRGQIDPRDGQVGEFSNSSKFHPTDAKYHPVSALSVFDGCFVPSNNTQVDSDGHHYNFPNSGRYPFYYITAGGTVSWEARTEPFKPELSGIDYSQPPHGFVLTHSNCGLTLDLAALRRLHPGLTPSRFTAIVGNVFKKFGTGGANQSPKADAFVLVDGKPRFAKLAFIPETGGIPVDVPLRNSDRFLTLVVTDGGDTGGFDWVIFADPRIE